ncbi:MAG: AMP-dependent synthetase/ligase [Nannocystaceae bacterium]|nr:AMP-binding protein [bacterium]
MRHRFESLVDMQSRVCTLFAGSRLFGVQSSGAFAWSTYDAFGHDVDGFRGALTALGVGRGDRVAVVGANSVSWAVAAFATYGLGAVYVPIMPNLPRGAISYALRDSGAKVVIVGTVELAELVRGARAELPAVEHVLCMEASGRPESFAEHLVRGHDVDAPRERVRPEDAATILYTSGTTGAPKGVVLSHGNMISNVNAVHQVHDIRPDDVSCAFLPWAHAFGLTCELFCMMSAGASIGLCDGLESLDGDLQAIRPTVMFAVPQIWNRIHGRLQKRLAGASSAKRAMFERALAVARRRREAIANGERSLRLEAEYALYASLLFDEVREHFGGRLRYALSGGAALSGPVAQLIEDIGIEMYEGYGLTETSPIVTTNTPDAKRLGTVGRSIPGVDVFICDEDGRVLGPGHEGEVVVSGPNVMLGYHNDDEATDAVIFDLDGLRAFRTGDLGQLSPGGFLTLTGRLKEQYKLGDGTLVVPTPIQQRLELSPLIRRASVHGDNRDYSVALLDLDMDALRSWAAESGLTVQGDLLDNPDVRARIDAAIELCFEGWDGHRPTRWAVVPGGFSLEAGEVTPKQSLRHRKISKTHAALIQTLYDT